MADATTSEMSRLRRHIMCVAGDGRGFALVEALVALVVVAILVGVAILVVDTVGYDPSAAACRREAARFEKAVAHYHARDNKSAWPPRGQGATVLGTAATLRAGGDLDVASLGDAVAHLDASQRVDGVTRRGWTYDFETHHTDAARC